MMPSVLLDCCYLGADLVTAVTVAAAASPASQPASQPALVSADTSPNYCVYWKLKIYKLMKRGKHYRRCDVINSSPAPRLGREAEAGQGGRALA